MSNGQQDAAGQDRVPVPAAPDQVIRQAIVIEAGETFFEAALASDDSEEPVAWIDLRVPIGPAPRGMSFVQLRELGADRAISALNRLRNQIRDEAW